MELTLRPEPGGRYTVALRLARPWRRAERELVLAVLAEHRRGCPRWDRCGVVVYGLYQTPARRLERALAAVLGLDGR
ncbi:hypothetical protein DYH09_35100 [bacterium CPR1]|nr:hypothetical protein [bacterium CPR1]